MAGKIKKSEKWMFSPLVFLAAAGLVALAITKGETDYPFLLIGGITSFLYVWPKWRQLPDSDHNLFMLIWVTAASIAVIWMLYNYILFLRKDETHD